MVEKEKIKWLKKKKDEQLFYHQSRRRKLINPFRDGTTDICQVGLNRYGYGSHGGENWYKKSTSCGYDFLSNHNQQCPEKVDSYLLLMCHVVCMHLRE